MSKAKISHRRGGFRDLRDNLTHVYDWESINELESEIQVINGSGSPASGWEALKLIESDVEELGLGYNSILIGGGNYIDPINLDPFVGYKLQGVIKSDDYRLYLFKLDAR